MTTMHCIDLLKLLGTTVLAGRLAAQAARPGLERALSKFGPGQVLLVSLAGIAHMTPSYFNGCLWPALWESSEAEARDLYPIIHEANEDVMADLTVFLKAVRRPALTTVQSGNELKLVPLNLTESSSTETYELLAGRGFLTASDIHQIKPAITQTGWNNRLALLNRQRIIYRTRRGRELLYSIIPQTEWNQHGPRISTEQELKLCPAT